MHMLCNLLTKDLKNDSAYRNENIDIDSAKLLME